MRNEHVWMHMMARKVRWETCRGPGSSVRLQLGNLEMKWPRNDTHVSHDNSKMNLKETCLDDLKNMMVIWSKEKF